MEAMTDIWGKRLRGLVIKRNPKTVIMKVRGPTGTRFIKRHIKKHHVVFDDDFIVWKDVIHPGIGNNPRL